MTPNNLCQECGKRYDKAPARCMCGWFFVTQEPQKNDPFLCQFFVNGKQCDEAGTMTYFARSKDLYCSRHAGMLRDKSFKR